MPTPRRSTASQASAASTPIHHKTADELAHEEALKLLKNQELGDEDDVEPESLLSPRARRHAILTRAREASIDPNASVAGREEDAASSSSESDSDSSDSESDSGDSASDSDEDDSDEDELEGYLAAAKAAAAASEKVATSASTSSVAATGDDDELRFDAEAPTEAPIPDLSVPALPPQVLSLAEDGTARAGVAGPSKARSGAPELDRGAYERALSKREKMAQPKKATLSELWATIPSARADELSQMKRDYQALALSHTLDPKRFMKGGNRATKVPESFQIGTMVDAPRHLQDTTVRKERKYRAGEIVAGLVGEQDLGAYAKRKFEDLQGKRMSNGRNKGWQKRQKW